jgi:hypothetical protein
VKLVVAAIQEGRISVFRTITLLELLVGSVISDLNEDPNETYVLRGDDVFSLLEVVSSTLKELVITQSFDMIGFEFPALMYLYNWDPSQNGSELPASVISSCPQLRMLHATRMEEAALIALLSQQPHRMEELKIWEFVGTLNDSVGQFVNLKRLSLYTPFAPVITNSLFQNMHKLEKVTLIQYREDEDEEIQEVPGIFSDTGVKILLRNNQQLEKVTLYGFALTDRSLELFTEYVRSHGLVKLKLESTSATKFTLKAMHNVVTAGFANKVRKIRIKCADREFEEELNDE